jgi:hypothetical protein
VTHATVCTGGVDVAPLLSTDLPLSACVPLDDDHRLQPAENVPLLLRREVVERWGPGIIEVIQGAYLEYDPAIDAVSHQRDTETLRELDAADAEIPGSDDIAAFAAAWLRSKGLP